MACGRNGHCFLLFRKKWTLSFRVEEKKRTGQCVLSGLKDTFFLRARSSDRRTWCFITTSFMFADYRGFLPQRQFLGLEGNVWTSDALLVLRPGFPAADWLMTLNVLTSRSIRWTLYVRLPRFYVSIFQFCSSLFIRKR